MTAQVKVDPGIFRRSDVRGLCPGQLNLQTAKVIGKAFYEWIVEKKYRESGDNGRATIAIGRDIRVSSGEIFTGLAEGIMAAGGNVIDLDLIGTEVISFASSTLEVDGGVVVSASHNPQQYNGVKLVRKGAVPISFDSGLEEIRELTAVESKEGTSLRRGNINRVEILDKWTEFIKTFIKGAKAKPLVIVIDAGNGMGGMMVEHILPSLKVKVTKLFFEPDGDFPNHVPNPLLAENLRDVTAEVKRQKADLGMAFDGDADRVIFIDENGSAINSSVIGAVIAQEEMKKHRGATVLYNAVCGRIVPEAVAKMGGKSLRTMVGHSVIKEMMRSSGAIFAVEHSGHFYYRDYFESDSSMMTIIKVLEIVSARGRKLSEIARPFNVYFQSGEINFETDKKDLIIEETRKKFIKEAKCFDRLDGVSLWFNGWWFNLRPSQNEDLLRLNIEAETGRQLAESKARLVRYILSHSAKLYFPY